MTSFGTPVPDRLLRQFVQMDITQLLHELRDGRSEALERLIPVVYEDLRRVARAQLRGRRPGDSLDSNALVHEAYVRLVEQSRAEWNDRGHFFAVSAIAMRQIVVDHARRRASLKRGGDKMIVPLDDAAEPAVREAEHVLEIDRALTKLAAIEPRLAQVVECRYFAGLSEEETAAALDVSMRTAQRDWYKARAWLRAELSGAGVN